jgi:hypothetical protein
MASDRCFIEAGESSPFHAPSSMPLILHVTCQMEYTTTMFMRKLRAIADDTLKGVTKAAKEGLKNNPEFRKLEKRVELLLNETSSGADRHPKLRKMKDLVSWSLSEMISKMLYSSKGCAILSDRQTLRARIQCGK